MHGSGRKENGKITVSPILVFLLCAAAYSGHGKAAAAFLLSAGCHECAHLAAMRALKMPLYGIRFLLGGAEIRTAAPSYSAEMAAAAAGPAANLLLYLLTRKSFPQGAMLNLCLFFCNLLPLWPSDGGRILRAALQKTLSPQSAERTFLLLQTLSGALTLTGGLIAAFHTRYGAAALAAACGLLLRAVLLSRSEPC